MVVGQKISLNFFEANHVVWNKACNDFVELLIRWITTHNNKVENYHIITIT